MNRQARLMRSPDLAPRGRVARAHTDSRLTRARILQAGLELLGQAGVGRVSMRTLADSLGTAPMSLYRHVRNKDDLLNGIVTTVLERLDFDLPERGPWTERAAAWTHALRNQLLRSPAVVAILMQQGHYAPALLRATNTLLRILREAGFEGRDAVRACREIMWSTLAFVAAEIEGPTFSPAFYLEAMGGGQRAPAVAIPPQDVAEVAALMPHFLTRDLDEVFSHLVKHLLAGLAAELAEARASADSAGTTRAAMR